MLSRTLGWALIFAATGPPVAPLLAGTGYDPSGEVRSADFVPAAMMRGANWTVAPTAANDGLENTYVVTSRFGDFTARGTVQLGARITEVEALARLEEVSKTEVFKNAVKTSATAPIRLVQQATERPVETVKGVPQGVNRWFQRTKFQVEEAYHDVSEQTQEMRGGGDGEGGGASEIKATTQQVAQREALDYLRITAAERRWYRELGVDPSTDNEMVRDGVRSVARVEGLTTLGMKFVGLPSVPGAGEIGKALDVVWGSDPAEVMLANRKRMLAAGLSEETARAFEDSQLTLTQQVAFLDALGRLEGVAGRRHLFSRALGTGSRDEARDLTVMTTMLAQMHAGATPLSEILGEPMLPVARARDGRLVAASPASAVFWTEPVAEGMRAFAGLHSAAPARERRLCVGGVTSKRFEDEAAALGWTVVERCRPK